MLYSYFYKGEREIREPEKRLLFIFIYQVANRRKQRLLSIVENDSSDIASVAKEPNPFRCNAP